MTPARTQHPLDTRRHQVDWSARLPAATLTGNTWTATPAGLTVTGVAAAGQVASALISGGTDGQAYTVTNRVSTAAETLDQSFTLTVREAADRLFDKDPDAAEAFAVAWEFLLDGATIADFGFLTPTGPDAALTAVASQQDGTDTLVKLAGGTAGETYRVRAWVLTSDGQTVYQVVDVYVGDA